VRRQSTEARALLIIGLALTGIAQVLVPASHPLFDGVVVVEPYRFLEPASGQEGSPLSANETVPMKDGTSPPFAVYTGESPPQAELLARGGELTTGSKATSVKVVITPIAPPVGSRADVAGNVYHVTVTDQSGTALALVPGETVTLALRGPEGTAGTATIAHLAEGSWKALPTSPSGLQSLFLSNIDAFGDFAVLGNVAATPSGMSPALLVAALIAAGVIGFFGLRLGRSSGSAGPGSHPSRRRPARGVRR
jgi:hypothetical protein